MLTAGSKLGPYEILDLLGSGGMGEVYRARDPRIGREVAIKILPSTYSEDSNRLTRFEQEARATGVLNHPNILAIYDVGTDHGAPYLVSELLDGETLRKKLETGPLPKRKAVDYAMQMIKGLAAAHEKGIIHRDLKPENLFVTKDGRLKILDFGLAKLIRPEPVNPEQSKLQTMDAQSQPGLILGTLGYMSPEQVRGRPADNRSDIFTFGTIFYEMLTRKKAFHGETMADTMSAILHKDPVEDTETSRNVPAGLQRIMDRCMEKDPEDRFQSAHDLSFALEAVSGSSDTATTLLEGTAATTAVSRSRKLPIFWAGGAALLLATTVLFGFGYFKNKSKQPLQVQPPVRFEIVSNEKIFFSSLTFPSVSPDGRQILFQASDPKNYRLLFVRAMDSLGLKRLAGTENTTNGFWSADSRSVAFFSQGALNRIDLESGAVQAICDASIGRGGSWNRDNIIVFSPASNSVLFQVPASGGKPTPVTELKAGEISHRFPQFLPDGKHFLFLSIPKSSGADKETGIYVGSLESKEKRFLLSTGMNALFAPPDFLFFVRQSRLMVQHLDLEKMQLTGEPRPVIVETGRAIENGDPFERLGFVPSTGQASFSVSENGVLAYRAGSSQQQLTLLNREGKVLGTVGPPGVYEDPALSPDGKKLAVTRDDFGSAQNVWIHDFERSTFSRFTFNPVICDDPVWSPNGENVAYAGEGDVYVKPSSGAQGEKLLYQDELDKVPLGWSPEEQSILVSVAAPKTGADITLVSQQGKSEALLHSEFNEMHAQLSPDGKWITYASDESGTNEVYVQSFPDLAKGKWQISSDGGVQPRWRKDGKELFYLAFDGTIMAVTITANAAGFQAGTPRGLFQSYLKTTDPRRPEYDVFPDGQQFLVIMSVKSGATPMNVIVNWPALLNK